jgi:hypothetical protein
MPAVISDAAPDLTNREALCRYRSPGTYGARRGEKRGSRHGYVKSSVDLPFFEHHPDKPFDEYYCGCFGWD